MANILYTTKSGTQNYTGVTQDSWFQIMDERNKIAVDFVEANTPQITPDEFSPKDPRIELNLLIGYAQDTAANALDKINTIEETYTPPKLIYIIDGDTGGSTYDVDESYDRVYLKNTSTGITYSEIILPPLNIFKDNQKITFIPAPNSVFNGRITWYDDNGTKNYIDALISKENPIELSYWKGIGTMAINGNYTSYTFDENMYLGFIDNSLGYSFGKYDKDSTSIYSNNLTTGVTNDIKTDIYGNVYIAQSVSGDTVVKLDQEGNKFWGLTLGIETKTILINGGILYIGGDTFTSVIGNVNIAAYTLDGEFIWGAFYDGVIEDMALSNDGQFLYVVGTPNTTGQIKVYSTIDGIMMGEVNDINRPSINAINVTPFDTIIVGGTNVSGTTFSVYTKDFDYVYSGDLGSTVYDIISNNDYFYVCGEYILGQPTLIKCDYDDGSVLDQQTYGASLYKMVFDAGGNIYAVGDVLSGKIGEVYDKELIKLDDINETNDARAIYVK